MGYNIPLNVVTVLSTHWVICLLEKDTTMHVACKRAENICHYHDSQLRSWLLCAHEEVWKTRATNTCESSCSCWKSWMNTEVMLSLQAMAEPVNSPLWTKEERSCLEDVNENGIVWVGIITEAGAVINFEEMFIQLYYQKVPELSQRQVIS